MDDQLDNKLKQRVKEVFGDYDPASADAGWLLLREKFPKRRRRRAVLWIWSAAAVLLLFMGFAIRMYVISNKQVDDKKISDRVKAIQSSKPALPQQKRVIAYQQTADTTHNNPSVQASTTIVQASAPTVQAPTLESRQFKRPRLNDIARQTVGHDSTINHSSLVYIARQENRATPALSDSAKKAAPPNTFGLVADAQRKAEATDTPAKQFALISPKPNKTIGDMFAADKGKTADDLSAKKDKKVRFGVYAATYFNYAKGSNNQVNAGAGFTADITLASNLELVTGLSVNQNSFAYNNSGGGNYNFPAAASYGANNSGNSTTYIQDASLIGLDIPLNLKYVLNYRKNQVYVLAGVGSGTFINESYGYVNSNGSTAPSSPSGKGFNDFYFARNLNIALGVGYPLGKDQIVIEPFVKYPLQGLGSEQLRFGASGINLKFNFSIKK